MWPWRRSAPFENLGLPKKCFISHAYTDAKERKRLLALLPTSVEPIVFPPIVVPPEQMVSDNLLDAIRACDGLIYLQGGASAESFWVALERDYALRLDKRVFAFDAIRLTLSKDRSPPMTLKVFISYAHGQIETARRIVNVLRKRSFDVWIDIEMVAGGNFVTGIGDGIEQAVLAGGYVIVLCSDRFKLPMLLDVELRSAKTLLSQRVLFALLDNTTEIPSSVAAVNVVQMYGDIGRSEAQRLDDLIVRLYWLIYRNTRQNQFT